MEQVPACRKTCASESALRESQDKFAQAFHGSIDAVAIADFPSGAMTEVNDAYCRLFGYTHEEAIGRSGNELGSWAYASDRENFIEILAREGAVREMEAVKLRRNGERLICRITSYRMKLGDRAVHPDPDPRHHRAAHGGGRPAGIRGEIFQGLPGHPDAIAITTLAEGRILDLNDAYTRTFGWSREESIGRTTLELNIWADPAQRIRLVQRLRAGEIVHNDPVVLSRQAGGDAPLPLFWRGHRHRRPALPDLDHPRHHRTSSGWRSNCATPRRWSRSASWPAAWRMTSTTS